MGDCDINKETNDKKVIDVEYNDIEIENVIYLSAPQMAKKVGTTEATIRTWADADVYGDLIEIEKINGRKTYKETQVPCFTFIKDLVENKNMKKSQVRKYISKHGFKYAEYNSGLVDPKDPLGFEALASTLTIEVKKELDEFKKDITNDILNQVDDRLKKYIMLQGEAINNVLDNTILKVDEVVSEKLENSLNNITEHINNNLNTKLNNIKSEIATDSEKKSKSIFDKIDDLSKMTKQQEVEIQNHFEKILKSTTRIERRKEIEEEKKKYSIWNKFKNSISFKKNKDEE